MKMERLTGSGRLLHLMSFVQLSGRSWDGTEVVERFIKIISNEIIMNEIVIKKLFISIDNMNINIYNYDINNLGKIREIL